MENKIKECYDNFSTGDLILFYGGGWISNILTWATGGSYSHVAMILKDPININVKLEGLYIIEANYPIKKRKKEKYYKHPLIPPEIITDGISNGVQIIPFEDIFNRDQCLYYRKLHCNRDEFFDKKIYELHNKVHNKPYDLDIRDWILAEINIITDKNIKIIERTDSFWCSALIGYLYVKLGFLQEDIDWSLLTPNNFCTGKKELEFINCNLDKEIKI